MHVSIIVIIEYSNAQQFISILFHIILCLVLQLPAYVSKERILNHILMIKFLVSYIRPGSLACMQLRL